MKNNHRQRKFIFIFFCDISLFSLMFIPKVKTVKQKTLKFFLLRNWSFSWYERKSVFLKAYNHSLFVSFQVHKFHIKTLKGPQAEIIGKLYFKILPQLVMCNVYSIKISFGFTFLIVLNQGIPKRQIQTELRISQKTLIFSHYSWFYPDFWPGNIEGVLYTYCHCYP